MKESQIENMKNEINNLKEKVIILIILQLHNFKISIIINQTYYIIYFVREISKNVIQI